MTPPPARGQDRPGARRRAADRTGGATDTAALVVEALSGSALIQDLGRDHVASGVPVSGAFDRRAHRLALALVGTSPREATLEVWGSITLRCEGRALVAVTGRAAVELRRVPWLPPGAAEAGPVSWEPAPAWTALELAQGEQVRVTSAGRAYLAVRGGLPCGAVLGSRSTCLLGALGPAPLTRGQVLAVGTATQVDARPGDYCRPGPREAGHQVVGASWLLAPVDADVVATSRIGVRIRPGPGGTAGVGRADLPSLGVLPGAIQALPSGDWMVLGPDAGTMGGYPVLGVLAGDGLDRWAHVQPGDRVVLCPAGVGSVAVPPLERVLRVGEIG